MATVGGVLMTMVAGNQSGRFAGEPYSWPPNDVCQKVLEELTKRGVQPEEVNVGQVNSVGEMIAAGGAQAAQQVVEAAYQRGTELITIEQNTFFAYEARALVPGSGLVRATTLMPFSRLGELPPGVRDFFLPRREDLRAAGMSDNEIEALLRRLQKVDRDRSVGFGPRTPFGGVGRS